MGCWNHTCAVTNLPILYGEEVEVILLKSQGRVPDKASFCYPYTYYTPIPLTFHGKYNDYGAVEECEGVGRDIIVEALRDNLQEISNTEETSHKTPASKDDFDIDTLFILDHENRLFIKNPVGIFPDSPDNIRVNHIVVRKEVYDAITEEMTIEWWDRDALTQHYLKLSDLDRDLFTKDVDEFNSLEANDVQKMLRRMPEIGKSLIHDLIVYHGQGEYGMNEPIGVINLLRDVRAECPKVYDELLDNALRFGMFAHFMQMARKSWHVPSGQGSQDSETDAQELCARLTLSSAGNIKQHFEE